MLEFNITLLYQFALYLVLLFLLNLLLYRPLRAVMQERRQTIDGSKERAKSLEADIQDKMARYEEKLQEARTAGAAERAQLKAEANKKEQELLSEAREDATAQLTKIREQVGAEADTARTQLQDESRAHAEMIAAKVLGRAL